MIFFSARGCDVVNARGVRKHARFVHQGSSRDVCGHETRFEPRLPGEKCRKTFALIRINQPIRSALAHAHQIDNCNRRVIERKGERRTMKITSRNDFSAVSEDEWII